MRTTEGLQRAISKLTYPSLKLPRVFVTRSVLKAKKVPVATARS